VLGGKGGRIDLALYEGLFRMLDAQLPIHAMEGVVPRRTGSQDPYCWGTDVPGRPVFAAVRSAEAQWLVMSLPADRISAVNLICGGLPGDRLDLPALRGWTGLRNADSIRAQLQETGAEIAPVLDGLSIASEAYLLSRRDVVPVPDERFPSLFAPGPIVKADGNLAKPFRPRGVGESNAAIFGPSAESTL
jgi:formyl-CoA transferase